MLIQVETQRSETLYERVGGDPFFFTLVDHFYTGVESDPVLRPLYPRELIGPKRRLALFLIQYWGGPHTYAQERGQPRLRMRHFRFPIGIVQRDAWLRHMQAAVDASNASTEDAGALKDYFANAATSLMNQHGTV